MRKGIVKKAPLSFNENARIIYDKKITDKQFAFCEATINGEEIIKIVTDMRESDILKKLRRKIRYGIKEVKIKTIKTWDKI